MPDRQGTGRVHGKGQQALALVPLEARKRFGLKIINNVVTSKGRRIERQTGDRFVVRAVPEPYSSVFTPKMVV